MSETIVLFTHHRHQVSLTGLSFTNEAHLLTNDQTGERGQYIVFLNVPQAVLLQELITERGPLAKLKIDYFAGSETLIIKMPTESHEIAAYLRYRRETVRDGIKAPNSLAADGRCIG